VPRFSYFTSVPSCSVGVPATIDRWGREGVTCLSSGLHVGDSQSLTPPPPPPPLVILRFLINA
jgi:hypothetical protein